MIFYLLLGLLGLLAVLVIVVVWAGILAGGLGLSVASITSGAVLAGRRRSGKPLPKVHLVLTLAVASAGIVLIAVAIVTAVAAVSYLGGV